MANKNEETTETTETTEATEATGTTKRVRTRPLTVAEMLENAACDAAWHDEEGARELLDGLIATRSQELSEGVYLVTGDLDSWVRDVTRTLRAAGASVGGSKLGKGKRIVSVDWPEGIPEGGFAARHKLG